MQDAAEFVAGLQLVLDQYAHAMLHIGQGFTLQEKAEILAVTQGPLTKARDLWRTGRASPGQAAETVIARAPEWDTDHAMPASWALPGVRIWLESISEAACPTQITMHMTASHPHSAKRGRDSGVDLCLSCILQGSEEALYVYMTTPLGPALAQITEQHLLKGRAVRTVFTCAATPPDKTHCIPACAIHRHQKGKIIYQAAVAAPTERHVCRRGTAAST